MTDFARLEQEFRDRLEDGVDCALCGRHAKIYAKPLYAAMGRALLHVYRYFQRPDAEEWVHMGQLLGTKPEAHSYAGGDPSKLVLWGLLEARPGERPDGSHRVGFYRLTQLGRDFVEGRVMVHRRVRTYAGKVLGFAGPQVTLSDVLGEAFSLTELVGAEVSP